MVSNSITLVFMAVAFCMHMGDIVFMGVTFFMAVVGVMIMAVAFCMHMGDIVITAVTFYMAVVGVMIMAVAFRMHMGDIVIMGDSRLMIASTFMTVRFSGHRFMRTDMLGAIGMGMTVAAGIVPMRQFDKKRNGHQ